MLDFWVRGKVGRLITTSVGCRAPAVGRSQFTMEQQCQDLNYALPSATLGLKFTYGNLQSSLCNNVSTQRVVQYSTTRYDTRYDTRTVSIIS